MRVFLLLPLALFASCNPSTVQESEAEAAELADDAGIPQSKVRYFPPLAEQPHVRCGLKMKRTPVVGSFEARWFSQHLTAAGEPSLYLASQRSAQPRVLRFTWLRSFHPPVFIRIEEKPGGKHQLIAKALSGAGGYEPGKVRLRVERDLLPEEVRKLQAVLDDSRLFSLSPKECDLGLDGSEWIFERVDGHKYDVMTRWSPESGPARYVGVFLLQLSGWRFAEIY